MESGFYNFARQVRKISQIYIFYTMKLKNIFLAALAAAFTFASCEPVDPETPETPDQEETPGGTENPGGTEEPGVTYTSIADFNAAAVSSEVLYTVEGTIVSIEEINAGFQNATLTIADESGAQLYIYRMKPAGEDKIEELGLTLGDVLVVKGNRGEYNGKIQMVSPVYVSHEDKEAPAVVITEIGLAAFNALEDSNADLYRISGTIKEISAINTQYENVNVTIVDEAGNEVYIFRLKVADESDKTLEQLALKVGDVLTVVGNKGSHEDAPQMINGKYESHVAGTTPPAGGEEGDETETPENQVVETISGTFTMSGETLTLTTESGITITQAKVEGSTAVNESYNTAATLRVYKGHSLTFSSEKNIVKIVLDHDASRTGSDVTASVGTYTMGSTSSTWNGSAKEVVITNTGKNANVQLRPTSIKVTYEK